MFGAFAALTVVIHFLTNGAYGYFRDELYFIACAQHLAAGYVDMPPMVALVARLSLATMGDSLFALRFFPALAGGVTVAIAGVLAAELGGALFAQMLAMLSVMAAPIYLGLDTILTMNSFDPIFWMGCVWALIRILKGGDRRWWLVFGAFAGLGLENKESTLFLGFALILGLALTSGRTAMFNRWFVLGGALAMLLFAPTLTWQAMHGFPMLLELNNVRESSKNAPVGWLGFFSGQILLMSPVALPIWTAGLYFVLISPRGHRWRALGIAYFVLYALFVMLKGKIYYLAPYYPVLLAAGAVQLEQIGADAWRPVVRYALPTLIVLAGIIIAPMAIPILPVETFIQYERLLGLKPVAMETRKTARLPQTYADMFGWPEMAATVARVYDGLPSEERRRAAIFANNYGEAAAVDFFGARYGLPKSISGHMAYYTWGPRGYDGNIVITVGVPEGAARRYFSDVRIAANVGTEYSMPDEHVPVLICRNPRYPLAQIWPRTRIYR
jgi:4-amino-4-deoxy-L-arabinose transferase-like glycosyltransferase